MAESKDGIRFIPENVVSNIRIMHMFRPRNLIEGGIFGAINAFIVFHIPFIPSVKVLYIILFGLGGLIFGVAGIQNRSVTEYIWAFINFKRKNKEFHKRGIEHVKQTADITDDRGGRYSIAEYTFHYIKDQSSKKKSASDYFRGIRSLANKD